MFTLCLVLCYSLCNRFLGKDVKEGDDDVLTLFEPASKKKTAINEEKQKLELELESSRDAQRRQAEDLQKAKQRHDSETSRLNQQLDEQRQKAAQLRDRLSTMQRDRGEDATAAEQAWLQRVSDLQTQANAAASSAQNRIAQLERDLANAREQCHQQDKDTTRTQKEAGAKLASLQAKLAAASTQEQQWNTAQKAMEAEMRDMRTQLKVEQATCKALREAAAEAQVQVK